MVREEEKREGEKAASAAKGEKERGDWGGEEEENAIEK